MEQKDRDALFYNLKNIGQTVKRLETDRQYDAVEINKKLENIDKKLDVLMQRTDLLDKPTLYTPERLYIEHQNGASYRDLVNKSALSLSQVRTRINNYKKQITEQDILEGFDYE